MFYNVLVLLDGSDEAEVILQYVPSFVCSSGTEQVTLLRVTANAREADEYLSKEAAKIKDSWHLDSCNIPAIDIQPIAPTRDDVPETVADFVDAHDVDALMLTTGGWSGADWWRTGSTAQRVIRESSVPVYLARLGSGRHPRPGVIRRILVPLDGSLLSEQAIPFAEHIADNASAEVTLLSVVDGKGSHSSLESFGANYTKDDVAKYLDTLADNLRQSVDNVCTKIEEGPAGQQIAETAQDERYDLIVMSSHGHTGAGRGAFGGVTERVVHGCHVPVLVIPPHLKTPEMRED